MNKRRRGGGERWTLDRETGFVFSPSGARMFRVDPDAQAIVLFDKRTRTERVLTLVELAALLRVAMLGDDI